MSPWLAFAIDLGVIFLLLRFRPTYEHSEFSIAAMRAEFANGLVLLTVGASFLGGLALLANFTFGSIQNGISWLRDEPLAVQPSFVDFQSAHAGQELEQSISNLNQTGGTLRLIGGTIPENAYQRSKLQVLLVHIADR